MLINIEDMTMEEYEIWIRGGNSSGLGGLSINEMTMEEYDEMIQRNNGSYLDRPSSTSDDRQGPPKFFADEEDFTDEDEDEEEEWEKLEMWLTNKIDENSKYIPFPEKKLYSEETKKTFIVQKEEIKVSSQPKPIVEPYCPPIPFPNRLKTRSGNIFDSSPFIITNEFVEFQEEMIEETWFDAPVFDEEEELEQSLEDELAELNLFLTNEMWLANKIPSPTTLIQETTPDHVQESGINVNLIPFIITNEFVEFQEEVIDEAWFNALLMNEDMDSRINQVEEIVYSLEDFDSTKELQELDDLLDESETILLDETNENAKKNLNSGPIRRMPIKGHTPYAPGNINTPYVNFGHTPYETSVPKTSFWQDVFGKEVTHLNPRCEEVFLRETREWQDARVKHRKVLVLSNEALVLGDCLKNG